MGEVSMGSPLLHTPTRRDLLLNPKALSLADGALLEQVSAAALEIRDEHVCVGHRQPAERRLDQQIAF